MPNSLNVFKIRVESRCKDLGINQKILAERMQIKQPNVSEALAKGNPRYETLVQFARALECEPFELIKPDGALPTPPPQEPGVSQLLKVIEELNNALKEAQKKAAIVPEDALFRRLVTIWGSLEQDERESVLKVAETFMSHKMPKDASEPDTKRKKASS